MVLMLCACVLGSERGGRIALGACDPKDTKPCLFWVHIPKTGSFFGQTIVRVACPSYYLALANATVPGKQPPDRVRLPTGAVQGPPSMRLWPQKDCDVRLGKGSHGHSPYSKDGGWNRTAATLIRSPQSRLVSAFYYNCPHNCPMIPGGHPLKNAPGRHEAMANLTTIVKYLSGA